MKTATWVGILGSCLLGGCTLVIQKANPLPNVDLPEQRTSLGLVLDKAIVDEFTLPSANGIAPTDVHGWRQTLEAGFENGFGHSFAKATRGADLTLQILDAQLILAPAAVNGQGAVMALNAQIRFKAHLVDAKGKVLKRSSGTSEAKKPTVRTDGMTDLAKSAVESLYEKLAADFFAGLSGH